MLVNCVAYREGQKLADIPLQDVQQYMAQPNCFVWVAIRDPEPGELEQLQGEFNLHDLAVEDARKGDQRPKFEEYGRSLFVVVRTMELGDEGLHTGQISIFVGHGYVLSVRRGTRYGFAELRGRTEREPELLSHGPGYVLYALLDTVVDRYFPIMQLKHAVGPLLEVVDKFYGGRVPSMCAGLQAYFRDVHDHLVRLDQSIDSLRRSSAAEPAGNQRNPSVLARTGKSPAATS